MVTYDKITRDDFCTVWFHIFGREKFKHENKKIPNIRNFLLFLQILKTMNASFEDVELEKLITTQ